MKAFINKNINYIVLGLFTFGMLIFISQIFQFEVALASVFIGLTGLFFGRYLAGIWRHKEISRTTISILVVLLIVFAIPTIPLFYIFKRNEAAMYLILALNTFIESLLAGLLIKLLREMVKGQINNAETRAENSHSELKLLQSQLSPHFLFNTLNNLYGLSLHEHEKLPPLLLKLSELLRYSVYESKELYVPIKEEIAYLRNYIDFERLRIGDRLDLKIDIEDIDNSAIRIAPMLLIVFVENAFKHSKNTKDERIFVEMDLKKWGNSILFRIKNSHHNQQQSESVIGGFGLDNVKKRLELLYHNAHDLQINKKENSFEVNLRINAV
jgi:LytS/YehU family sensor histidine kinase